MQDVLRELTDSYEKAKAQYATNDAQGSAYAQSSAHIVKPVVPKRDQSVSVNEPQAQPQPNTGKASTSKRARPNSGRSRGPIGPSRLSKMTLASETESGLTSTEAGDTPASSPGTSQVNYC